MQLITDSLLCFLLRFWIFMDFFMISRASGLRVTTLPELGIFKFTLRTYNIHQDSQHLNFLESLICPLQAL